MTGAYTESPIRVAIVGYGYWGRNVARAMREGGFHVSGIYDTDGRACVRASRVGHHIYPTIEVALREADAVAVCTPPNTHAELAGRVIDAGRHLWIEKPIAPNLKESRALVAAARAADVAVLVDHTFTFAPALAALTAHLPKQLMHIEAARTHLCEPRDGTDVIGDLLPHDASILLACGVVVRAVHAVQRERDAIVALALEGGATANVYLSWASGLKLRRMTLYGSDRTIVYDHLDPREQVRIYGIVATEPAAWTCAEARSPCILPHEPLVLAAETFRAFCRDEAPDNADQALAVQAIVDAARQAARTRSWEQIAT